MAISFHLHSSLSPFIATKMIKSCQDNIDALDFYVEWINEKAAKKLNPIAEKFEEVVGQLEHEEVKPIGNIDGKTIYYQARPRPPFFPPDMAEYCEVHIAAIKGYLIDHPDSAGLLDPIIKNFKIIVRLLDVGPRDTESIGIIDVARVPKILSDVYNYARNFEIQITEHSDLIIYIYTYKDRNYDKVLRAKKFVKGKMLLAMCSYKLKYALVQMQIKTNLHALKISEYKGYIKSDLSHAISNMGKLLGYLEWFEPQTNAREECRRRALSYIKSKITDAIKSVADADKLLEIAIHGD